MTQSWTTADFEELCWHDCHIHGFRLSEIHDEYGTAELEFDIDFIVEWICEGGSCRFRVAPATLTFHEVSDLRIQVDYATPTAGMTPFSIDGISRERVLCTADSMFFRWRLPINWPTGEITFESSGFSQVLRQDPIETDRQLLTTDQRLG